jgi:hypothetical protein
MIEFLSVAGVVPSPIDGALLLGTQTLTRMQQTASGWTEKIPARKKKRPHKRAQLLDLNAFTALLRAKPHSPDRPLSRYNPAGSGPA